MDEFSVKDLKKAALYKEYNTIINITKSPISAFFSKILSLSNIISPFVLNSQSNQNIPSPLLSMSPFFLYLLKLLFSDTNYFCDLLFRSSKIEIMKAFEVFEIDSYYYLLFFVFI
jgi:hypothetical protein